jgi:lipopolysaccharide export system protein LptA
MSDTGRKWLRHGSMILILLLGVGLTLIAVQRVRRMSRPVTELDTGQMNGTDDDPVQGIYTGFRFVETMAGKLVFILNSVRTLGKSSGWHEIEGVRLQLFNEGAEGPLLTAEAARFNVETRDASLEGPVHVQFADGAMLNTASARFQAESRRLVAVLFTNEGSVGQAGHAAYWLEDDRLELSNGAVIRTDDGMSLRAPRIVYLRDKARIQFPDGCQISRNGSQIVAPKANVRLEANDGPPNRVEFDSGVTGQLAASLAGGPVMMWAESLIGVRDDSGNWQVEAKTHGPWIEVVIQGGDGFYERKIATLSLHGVVAPEGILNLRAERGVCLREIPVEGEPRRAEARSARVWFAEGQPTDTELRGEVKIHAEGIVARGDRARVSSNAGITMLHGDPMGPERATLVSDRGRISCDQVQMFDREGRVEARGDVQGQLEDVTILGTESDDEGANETSPVHFAAEVLNVTDGGKTFQLRENARLWQGQRLLLADEVVFRQDEEILDATGHVRTTLPAAQLDPAARAEDDVMVVARGFHFNQRLNHADYVGNVRYSDPEHILSANELSIYFDDANSITAVEAVGAVELVDLATGRRMTGGKARRDVNEHLIHVTGSPVQITDESGSMLSGSSLTWDQASGRVTVAGGTETIYYPEETP